MLISGRRNTRLIQTPVYNGLFLIFTCLIRTPVNADNEAQTLIHCQPLLLTNTADYLGTDYFPCQNHLLVVDIVHCSNNDRFLWV